MHAGSKNSGNKTQHIRLTLQTGNRLRNWCEVRVTASAVAEQVFEAGHQVDLSKASVTDYHPHTRHTRHTRHAAC